MINPLKEQCYIQILVLHIDAYAIHMLIFVHFAGSAVQKLRRCSSNDASINQ